MVAAPRVDPLTLRAWIGDGRELAILDAREEGEFGQAHLFWAVCCPLSRREMRARALLPRLSTRVVCVDGGPGSTAPAGLADQLADELARIGCTDVRVLDGGVSAWVAAGLVAFSGVNVPSKAFGEWVEHHYATESVDPPELLGWIEAGRDMVVLDSRTPAEFERMSIPTGISVPGGELAYRIGDLVPSPETLVVVNCAGRTRSILGAESLRQAGVANRVVALRNGTMGWELAGLSCARGVAASPCVGAPATAALALARAKKFAEAVGVGVIGALDLARFEDDPARTCYVLDVRSAEEFAAGHRPGSRSAPGGQLVQATDGWIGVRGARIALIDDDGVRARMAAAWLRQMGHRDVFVVEGGLDEVTVPGPGALVVPELDRRVALIAAAELAGTAGAVVVDVARSVEYRAGHIPGAIWGVRSRLGELRARLDGAGLVVATSPDGSLARLALPELAALTTASVRLLDGGTASWTGELAADPGDPPDAACIDFHLRPYDRTSGVEAAMRAYLSWEIDLLGEVERDGTVMFGVPTGA